MCVSDHRGAVSEQKVPARLHAVVVNVEEGRKERRFVISTTGSNTQYAAGRKNSACPRARAAELRDAQKSKFLSAVCGRQGREHEGEIRILSVLQGHA